jgi:hypothetical protein
VGFCVFSLLRPLAQPQPEAAAGAAFVAAFFLCSRALRMIVPTSGALTLPRFEAVLGIDRIEPEELVLTDADRLHAAELVLTDADGLHAAELVLTDADRLPEALVLDDILAEIGPDSRVVRLFDPSAVPTPGQLKARIDRHLAPAESEDATQALFEALAQLRRSLA